VNYRRGVFEKITGELSADVFLNGVLEKTVFRKKSRKAPREELIKILPKAALRQKIILPRGT
jgi:hypothetical protein